MVLPAYIVGMFRITNVLIAIFVLLYAFMFLVKTSRREERKPWDYLFFSALLFLIYQIFELVLIFADATETIAQLAVGGVILQFLFSGLILLAFVSQHDLIIRTPLILISRKITEEEKEMEKKLEQKEKNLEKKLTKKGKKSKK